jgi:hypothetical protein
MHAALTLGIAALSAAVLSVAGAPLSHAAPGERSGFSPGTVTCHSLGLTSSITFTRGYRSPTAFVANHGLLLARQFDGTYTVALHEPSAQGSGAELGPRIALGGGELHESYGGGVHPGMRTRECTYEFFGAYPSVLSTASIPFLEADGFTVGDGDPSTVDDNEADVQVGQAVVAVFHDLGEIVVQSVGRR